MKWNPSSEQIFKQHVSVNLMWQKWCEHWQWPVLGPWKEQDWKTEVKERWVRRQWMDLWEQIQKSLCSEECLLGSICGRGGTGNKVGTKWRVPWESASASAAATGPWMEQPCVSIFFCHLTNNSKSRGLKQQWLCGLNRWFFCTMGSVWAGAIGWGARELL
jgi:hypothetical protein